MMLELIDAERVFLTTILEEYLAELRSKLAKDGRLDWMIEIKKKADVAQGILAKLQGADLRQAI
jgi:hypothetical protein